MNVEPIETFTVLAQDCCVPARQLVLDEVDHRLLALLQEDAGRTLLDLGTAVGLSPSAVQRRIKRFQGAGLLARQVALLDPRQLPEIILAVCLVTLERESSRDHAAFRKRLLAAAEVQQVYAVSGEYDVVVVIAARGMARHTELTTRLIMDAPNVKRFTTLFVLDPVKIGHAVPTR